MYRRTRPQDVPAEMIEKATARRLAGDVAGAFTAARIELEIDIAQVVRLRGHELADQVIDDLHHLAPDLLRWHLPRGLPDGGHVPDGVLREYPGEGGAQLMVDRVRNQPGRLRLWVRTVGRGRVPGWYHLPRAYWDARYTGELRALCGAGPDRIPFHDAGGNLLAVLPDGPRPEDPVAMTEWLTLLWDAGRTGEALAACGVTLADGQQDRWPKRPWVAVERLVADARRVLDEGVFDRGEHPPGTIWVECRDEGQAGADIELTFGPGELVTARMGRADGSWRLTVTEFRHPIDLDLLRFGLARPGELHPAVTEALFPSQPADPPAARIAPPAVGSELMDRAVHRDTAGVVALLDAGADPLVRDRSGQTLLHLLPHLDHEVLLPRLLAAGVDVNAVDVQGYTALHAAAAWRKQVGDWFAKRTADDLIGRLRNAGGRDFCGRRGVQCRAGAPGRRRPPSGADVDRLRAAAARPGYESMAELAWALYATGHDRRAVLAECFGVPFPDEFFALADHQPLPGHRRDDLRYQVWWLALPADRGGPVPADDDYHDRFVFERDPRLIPLLRLSDYRTEYGNVELCYDFAELAGGRPTIFGVSSLDRDAPVERLGPSLLAVLHDYHATVVDRLEALHRPATEQRDALRLMASLRPAGAPGVTRSEPTAPFLTPVSAETLARLRERASRDDYRSMARLAWALYAAGLGVDEVLSECLGVTLPAEFFVLAEGDLEEDTHGGATTMPWYLAKPLDQGGPVLVAATMTWRRERQIFAWDPDLLPVTELDDVVHCYRLSELAAGRTTVFGVPADEDAELSVELTGPSLLSVLHEQASHEHATAEWQLGRESNRGFGSIDHDDVDQARQVVLRIEELQRRVADTGGSGDRDWQA